jgi:hypothetical protein
MDKLVVGRGFACVVELLLKLNALGVEFAEIRLQLRYDQKPTATKMGVGSNISRLLSLSASSRAPASAPAEAIEVKTQVHPHLTAINNVI